MFVFVVAAAAAGRTSGAFHTVCQVDERGYFLILERLEQYHGHVCRVGVGRLGVRKRFPC